MKKFRFLLCLVVILSVFSLGAVAFAGTEDTVETYPTPYIGEYTSQDGSGFDGLAHIIFGKVSNVDAECGILLTDVNNGWTKKFQVKTNENGKKRINSKGEFAIALYNLPDGEYTACAYSGNDATRITGESITIRAGVAFYEITYIWESDDGVQTEVESVSAGSTPTKKVSFSKDGYKIAGFKTADGKVYNLNAPVYENAILYPLWVPDNTSRLTMSGNPSYITHEASAKSGETVFMEFDVVEILNFSSISNTSRIGFGVISEAQTKSGFVATTTENKLVGSGTVLGNHTVKSDYIDGVLQDIPMFKSGETVKVEYKPYLSSSDKGYIKVYVKSTLDSDDTYTLVGGVQDITTQVGALSMFTDRGTALDMIVANLSFSTSSGDLGVKNYAYAYETNGLYTKISNLTIDDEIVYDIASQSKGTIVLGSKTRLDLSYGDSYVMEFSVDFSNFGDYEAGVVNRQTGSLGFSVTSEDALAWNSTISKPNSISIWYNNSGWRTQAKVIDANNAKYLTDFSTTSDKFDYTFPRIDAFKELLKTGNRVRVVYTPYFSSQETGADEQLGSFVIYSKLPTAQDYSVWASITGLPRDLSPRDDIGMFIWWDEIGGGRHLTISDFTTRVGDTFVYSASGNAFGMANTTMNGVSIYAHSLSINKSSLNMQSGDIATLKATINPVDTVIWTSSDESVATVSDGVVTAVGEGTAIIRATALGGKSVKCTVTVKDGYDVTYMLNGEVYEVVRLKEDSGFTLSSIPDIYDYTDDSLENYYFGGWYLDEQLTVPLTLDTVFTSDTVVYGDYKCAYLYDIVSDGVVIRGMIDELADIVELYVPVEIDGVPVVEIGREAFKGSKLMLVDMLSNVERIGDGAFRDSLDLNFVNIDGTGLKSVGNSAFRGCVSLNSAASIVFPNSVESVGELAFFGASHPVYTKMYMLNYQEKEYYSPKYVWEFLGADVMPIATYGAFDVNNTDGVINPEYGVGLEQAIVDFLGAGFNVMEFNGWSAVQDYSPTTANSVGQYMKIFEDNGGIVIYKDGSMKSHKYEEYLEDPNVNLTLVHYNKYLYKKFASFGGVMLFDEPGWVEWVDEFEEPYSFYKREGSSASSALSTDGNGNYITVTKSKKGRTDDGHKYWQEIFPNRLMFINLLQTYAPKWALPNGYYGYNDGGQLNGVPSFTGRWAPLEGELDYEYYYRTYIESVKPEVFSYDYYPLADGGTNLKRTHFEQLNYANYYSGEYYKNYHGTETGVPFWPMIQLTGWNGYRLGVGANLNEVNWQINTGLAYGAKGFSYYTYTTAGGSAGSAVDKYGNKLDNYYVAQTANAYTQAMAKWLMNAEVDHLYQHGANPNCYDWDANRNIEPETTPARMLTPKDTSMTWRFSNSSGVNNIVSKMKYYANNNDYRGGVAGDVRELYFACNNSITQDGNITLNFNTKVSGSYIYEGKEYRFSGTSLTVPTKAGGAFAVLLDK